MARARALSHVTFATALSAVSLAWLGCFASACGTTTTDHESAVQRGQKDLDDPHAFSTSKFAYFACTKCHSTQGTPPSDRIYPGGTLEGAASRPAFWAGRFDSLHDAVNECVTHFQRGDAIKVDAASVVDLSAYLVSIGGTGQTASVPFTVTKVTKDLPPGDAGRGAVIWSRSCKNCHGDAHTGDGKIGNASRVPEDTQTFHGSDGPVVVREVVIEKIRTGSFLDFAGQMPPFSQELLTDGDVSDVVSYLGLYP